ncbi:MAG: hypothetical protein AAF235_01380 [Planctomycetota bacterium]
MAGRRSSQSDSKNGRQNTLGVTRRDLVDLLDDLDRVSGEQDSIQRSHTRWPFRAMAIRVMFMHPGGSEVEVRLACRNLSGGGVGLLHSAYVHERTPVMVFLPRLTGGEDRVRGTITRCIHREGKVHELGVRFDKEIDVHRYFEVDPLSGWFRNEHVDPDTVQGKVVHLESQLRDRQAVRDGIRESRVRIQTAETGGELLEMITEEINAVVVDFDVADLPISELLDKVIEKQPMGVLVTCAEPVTRARAIASRPEVVGVLTKPCDPKKALAGINEAINFDPSVLNQVVKVDEEMVQGFSQELGRFADVILKAARRQDAMAVYSACSEIRGNAEPLGFVGLGQLTGTIVSELSRTMDVSSVREELVRLIVTCRDLSSRAA